MVDSFRPIMRYKYINRTCDLFQAENFQVTNMVDTSLCTVIIGRPLKVSPVVIMAFEDTRDASNANIANLDHTCIAWNQE